jgi:phospholipase C
LRGVPRPLLAALAAGALAALLAADVRLSGGAEAQPKGSAPPAGASAGVAARGVIKHVVVIVQENRTFDNLFGGYVNASPLGPQAYPHANSTYPTEIVKYLQATNIDDGSGDNTHDSYACLNQTLPGQAPRFSAQRWIAVSKHAIGPAPCSDTSKNYSYFRYVPQVQRQVYWEIARTYALGDRFFAATSSASFPPHQFIVAGDVFFSAPGISLHHVSDQPSNFPQGCFNHPASATVPVVGPNVFSQYPSVKGQYGGCYPRTTYGDRLDAKNVSWIHYTTNLPTPPPQPRSASATPTLPPIHAFNGFTNIQAWYKQTAPLPTEHFRPTTQILTDAAAPSPLPGFLWVKPPCIKQSDHPGAHGHNGQNWVGSVINAIGNSPNWNSTAIFVIWDDWGGFYDHVVPPLPPDPHQRLLGRGVRIPFLVISPYLAKPGGVVSTEGHPGSIMRFANDLYGLDWLTEFDAQAPDLAGWFDFTKPPRPFVPIAGAAGAGAWKDSLCRNSSLTMED